MTWCPKCKVEYREGCKTCSDCGGELEDKPEYMEKATKPQFDKEAFLISVGDSIEADMLEELLNANSIPVLKKYREAGDYLKIYMGGTNFGVDLYVPSKLLSKAQEIVLNSREVFAVGELQADDAELQDDGQQDDRLQDTDEAQQCKAEQDADEAEQSDSPQDAENAENAENTEDAENEDTTIEANAFNRKRRMRTWIILLFFIPGLIWIIFALVSSLYQWLSGR